MTTTVENTPAAWSARANAHASSDAAMWSERGQTTRFLAVLAHLELRAGDTLLDFGCGTGRLRHFLPDHVSYLGHDTAPGMLARAAREGATIVSEIPAELFDHVVAIGPFNLADRWSIDDTYRTVARLWAESTRRTLVVSLYRGTDAACLTYDPVQLAAWARSLGARRFAIDATRLENDALLVMHR